jgi:hypothetical protein
MEQMCFVFPALPGMTDDARRFLWEMGHDREAEYDRSQRRIGITHEVWYLSTLPDGDYVIVYMRGEDLARSLAILAQSDDEFDRWFKQQLLAVAGIDLDDAPEMEFPELLLSYAADGSRG